MANREGTKERVLAVERILLKSKAPTKMSEILGILSEKYGITAERKAVYDDLAVLTKYLNVQYVGGRYGGWIVCDF